MKLSFLFLMFFISKASFCQCDGLSPLSAKDSMVKNYVMDLKTDEFKGETVAVLLDQKCLQNYCSRAYIQKIIGVLAGIELRYKGFVILQIFIPYDEAKKFKGKAASWNFEEVKKCSISRIKVIDDSDNK